MARNRYKESLRPEEKRGKPSIGNKSSKTELKKLYVKEGRSIRDVAKMIRCSKDMVYRALKEYGVPLRKNIEKRSKLQEYNLTFLKKEIRLKGFNQVASELGVHNTTLRRYIEKTMSQR